MSDNAKKQRKKYAPSSTQARRKPFYPTPQNDARLDKFTDNGRKCSYNEAINDALSYYLVNVHQVRIGL